MGRLASIGLWAVAVAFAQQSRVLFISLDGLGFKNLTEDPVARELTSLHHLAKRGFLAPLQTSFPSKTAPGHAALFTGAWAGVNGIFSNRNPRTPRSDYGLQETITGFRSDTLTAEPIWTAAARQGVSAVAYQATQMYPFNKLSAGLGNSPAPTVLNGYQSLMLAPHRVIRQRDVKEIQPGVYQWTDGPLVFRLERLSDGLRVSSGSSMILKATPLETGPPRKRLLARNFSDVLPVEANGIRTGVYFRLFEYSSSDFLLYRTSAQELASSGVPFDLQASDGPFVGNSALSLYERGMFGKPFVEGGDGTAERRYLETLELVVRQLTRHMLRLDERMKPRLLVGYYPVIDDLEHIWFGLASTGFSGLNPYRAWGYAALDEGLKPLIQRFAKHSILLSSDHGMSGITHEIRMGALLSDLGFAKETVVSNSTCLFINTTDWKQGIVRPEDRAGIVDELEAKLTAQGLFTRFYRQPDLSERFGLQGGNAPDLCFDVKPFYYPTEGSRGLAVSPYPYARGEHGFDPTRKDMESYVLASGRNILKRKSPGQVRFRAIDVASIAANLLGILPPAQSVGKPPPGMLAAHR